MVEVTIILKGEDKTFKEKHLCYEVFEMSPNSPHLQSLIQRAKQAFKCEVDEVVIKTHMQWE